MNPLSFIREHKIPTLTTSTGLIFYFLPEALKPVFSLSWLPLPLQTIGAILVVLGTGMYFLR